MGEQRREQRPGLASFPGFYLPFAFTLMHRSGFNFRRSSDSVYYCERKREIKTGDQNRGGLGPRLGERDKKQRPGFSFLQTAGQELYHRYSYSRRSRFKVQGLKCSTSGMYRAKSTLRSGFVSVPRR